MGALTQVLNYQICSLSSSVHVHAFPSTTLLCCTLPSPPPLGSFFTHPSPDHSPHLSLSPVQSGPSPTPSLCSLVNHSPSPVIKFTNILYVYQWNASLVSQNIVR